MELTLKVDVLETYWSQIQNCPAVYERSDCFPNQYLNDGFERVSVQRDIEYVPFWLVEGGNLTTPFDYPSWVYVICNL